MPVRLFPRLVGRLASGNIFPGRVAAVGTRHVLVHRPPAEASDLVARFSEDLIVEELLVRGDIIEQLIDTRKSLIRFGDGEVQQLIGKDLRFQESSPVLRKGLYSAYFDYSENSPYLLAVPDLVRHDVGYLKRTPAGEHSLWYYWWQARGLEALAMRLGRHRFGVFDSLAFCERKVAPNPIWEHSDDVCIVTNQRVHQRVVRSEDFAGKRVHFVRIPEAQALSSLKRVVDEVGNIFCTQHLDQRNVPVLVAGGTVGKLIVLSLMRDFWAIDIGSWLGPWLPKPEHVK